MASASSSSSDKIYLEPPRTHIKLYTTILTDGTQKDGIPPPLSATLPDGTKPPAGTTYPIAYPNNTDVEILSIKRTDNKQPGFSLVKVGDDVAGYIRTTNLLRTGANMRPFIPPWATAQQKSLIISTFQAPLNPRDLPVFQMNVPKPHDVHEYLESGKYYKMNADGNTSWYVQDPATGNYYLLSDTGPQGVSLGGTRRRKCKKGKKSRASRSSHSSRQLRRRRHSRHHRRR